MTIEERLNENIENINPTNGDVILDIFGPCYIEVIKDEYDDETGDIYVDIDGGTLFSLDWWNSPYKKGDKE